MKRVGFLEVAAIAALSSAAVAQSDDRQEIEALKKRVSELEAKQSAPGSDTVKWNEIDALGSKWKLYGWLRLDAVHDDSRPDNDETIQFIRSEDANAPAAVRAKSNNGDFTMYPKLTRLGLDFFGPSISSLWDAQTGGKLETDFYNATGTESREALRIRVAYLQLHWPSFNLYAGQMWDLASPLNPIVNPDMVLWNAGNLGDRRPQVRGEWIATPCTDGKLFVQAMAGQTGAIDSKNLDGNGFRDGDQSGVPTLQARVAWRQAVADWKQDFEVGAWAHRAVERTDTPIGTAKEKEFLSSAYGIDMQVPIWEDVVWFKGEAWHGRDLSDIRGGITQGVNATTGEEIASRGGWAEIGVKVNEHVKVYAGGSVDNPDNNDLNNGNMSRNQVWYGAIHFDFKPIAFGLDYMRWTTDYKGFDPGKDNRLQAYIQYSF